MLWFLLVSLAIAEPPTFGPEPPPEVVAEPVQPSLDQLLAAAAAKPAAQPVPAAVGPQSATLPELGNAIPWGLALLGAGATFLWVRRRTGSTAGLRGAVRPPENLAIVARQPLGAQGTLLLVEAEAGDGRTRRLLLSTSTSGVPTLVADLGAEAIPEVPVEAPAPLPQRQSRATNRRPARPFQLPDEPELTPSQGRSLVDELLAERRGYGARRSA